jgi:hypothetical protein
MRYAGRCDLNYRIEDTIEMGIGCPGVCGSVSMVLDLTVNQSHPSEANITTWKHLS